MSHVQRDMENSYLAQNAVGEDSMTPNGNIRYPKAGRRRLSCRRVCLTDGPGS